MLSESYFYMFTCNSTEYFGAPCQPEFLFCFLFMGVQVMILQPRPAHNNPTQVVGLWNGCRGISFLLIGTSVHKNDELK